MRAAVVRSRLIGAALAIGALSGVLWLGAPAEALTGGPEIRVNAATADRLLEPVIAADPAGGFVAAWAYLEDGASDTGIYVRRFDADGEALTGAIRVNITAAENQRQPAITAEPGGGFTVAWTSFEQDGSGAGVYARRLDAAATPLGAEIAVNTATLSHQSQPAIAADPGGGFTVTWASLSSVGSGWDVYARRFDTAGAPLTGEIAVNTGTEGDQEGAVVAADGSGGFTVAWESRLAEDSPRAVYARRFDSSGAPLSGEISVDVPAAGSSQFQPAIAGAGSAGFVVTWGAGDLGGLRARRFDAAGAPSGASIRVDPGLFSPGQSGVIADPGGGFTVAWVGRRSLTLASELFARRFDAAGSPLTTAVAIDPAAGDGKRPERPALAADGGGGFTVSWEELGEGDRDAYARHFSSVPETGFDAAPRDPTKDATPTFAFSSDEYGSTFECRLDDGGFEACGSPFTAAPLADGPHSFEVRATNPDGQTDATPAARSFTVDTVVPDTSLDSGPAALSSESTPTFTFSSDDQSASFECQLDAEPYRPCATPLALGPLADGGHALHVRARDEAGNLDASPAGAGFTIDTDPPDISIEFRPDGPGTGASDPTPTFVFAVDEEGSTFQCQVDGGATSPCGSPFTTAALADGPHVLSVWGTDEAGNTTLATRSFTIDTAAPETSIGSGPPAATNEKAPSFAFSSSEPGARFECSVDGASFTTCASPLTLPALGEGAHSFAVRAIDAAENTDSTPATRSFTIDTAAPETSIGSGPPAATNEKAPSFAFSSSEPGGGFECSVDGSAFTACGSPAALGPLAEGVHTFAVRAIDAASNADPTPAARSFAVDTAPPLLKLGRRRGAARQVVLRVRCGEPCKVRAGGAIVGAAHLRVRLSGGSAQLAAGESDTLRLRSKRGKPLRRLQRLLAKGSAAAAKIRLEAVDAAGNSKARRVSMAVRPRARAKRG